MNFKPLLRRALPTLVLSSLFVASPARAQEKWNPDLIICGAGSDGVWQGTGTNCIGQLPPLIADGGDSTDAPNDFSEVIDPISHDHHLLVADMNNGRVLRYLDQNGQVTFVGELGWPDGGNDQHQPFGVVGDKFGDILVVDRLKSSVYLFDWNGNPLGNPIRSCAGDPFPGGFNGPYRAALAPGTSFSPANPSGTVFIVDTGNNRVVMCDGSMNFVGHFGNDPNNTDPTAVPAFSAPTAVAIDAVNNLLYVASPNIPFPRVQVFNWNGSLALGSAPIWTISNEAPATNRTSVGEMVYPFGVAIDANQRLLVADAGANKMFLFDSYAKLPHLSLLPSSIGSSSPVTQDFPDWPPPPPGDPGQLAVPANITLDSTGRLMIADAYNMRVQRFNHPAMTASVTPPSDVPAVGQPFDVTVALQTASGSFDHIQLAFSPNSPVLGTPTVAPVDPNNVTVTAGSGTTSFTMTFTASAAITFPLQVWGTGIPVTANGDEAARVGGPDGSATTEPIAVGASGHLPQTTAIITSSGAPVQVTSSCGTTGGCITSPWYVTPPFVHVEATGSPVPTEIDWVIQVDKPDTTTTFIPCPAAQTNGNLSCNIPVTADGLSHVWYRAKSVTTDTPPQTLVADWKDQPVRYDALPPLVLNGTPPTTPAQTSSGWNNTSFKANYTLLSGAVGWPQDAQGNTLVPAGGFVQVTVPTQPDSSSFMLPVPRFLDAAGRATDERGAVQIGPFKLDTVKPLASCQVSASAGPNTAGWYNVPVTLAFSATDDRSGVDPLVPADRTLLNQQLNSDFVNKVVPIPAGFFQDLAGNKSLAVNCAAVNIDVTKPTVTAALSGTIVNGWVTSGGVVTFTASDATSGVQAVHYDLLDATGATVASANLAPGTTLPVSNPGKNRVVFYAVDKAGNQSDAATINVWVNRPLTVTAKTDTKQYDGTNASSLTPTVTGFFGTDTGTFTQVFNNAAVATGKTLTASGTVSPSNTEQYTVTFVASPATGVINKRTIPAASVLVTVSNKVYSGNTTATVTGCSFAPNTIVTGETVTCAVAANGATFASSAAAVGSLVNVTGVSISGAQAGNYVLAATTTTTTATITPKALTATLAATSKTYDATTAATTTCTLTGVVAGDTVTCAATTATFASAGVGNGKTVTAALALGGTSSGNYSLSNTTATATANITARSVTPTVVAANKVYDNTTTATITSCALTNAVAGDAVGCAVGSAAFANATIGNGKTVTASGITLTGASAANYTLSATTATTTANITGLVLTAQIVAADKVYDGTTTAAVTCSLVPGVVLPGQTVTCSAAGATFASANVGSGQVVTATGITLGGASAANYTLAQTTATATASITPRAITAANVGLVAADKVYDGTTSATITSCTVTGTGVVAGDTVTCAASSAAFASAGVGTTKTVTASGLSLSGTSAANYTLNGLTSDTTTANITPRTIAASNVVVAASNKVYDGTTTATASCTLAAGAVLAGDTVTCAAGTATFADANAGTGKTVTVTGLTIAGTSAANYTLASSTATATANITAAPTTTTLAASATSVFTGQTVVFTATIAPAAAGTVTFTDGTTVLGTATLSGSTATLSTTALAAGSHSITATYAPTTGNTLGSTSAPVLVTVNVSTNQLPVCTAASASPGSLWPPNHKFVPITINGVTDPDGPASGLTIVVTKIWQDESTMIDGSGDTPIDGAIVNGAAQVRAERSGKGNGRIYQIFFTATDLKGGSCTGSVTVGVPHDQSGAPIVDSGVRYDSLVANGPIVSGSSHIPVVRSDVASTLSGIAVSVAVLANDTDPDGNALTVTAATGAAHGTTTINTNGTVTYKPANGFTGVDTFTYTVSDGTGNTASGIVTVTVGVHFSGDGCDHDLKINGHRDGDGDAHDKTK